MVLRLKGSELHELTRENCAGPWTVSPWQESLCLFVAKYHFVRVLTHLWQMGRVHTEMFRWTAACARWPSLALNLRMPSSQFLSNLSWTFHRRKSILVSLSKESRKTAISRTETVVMPVCWSRSGDVMGHWRWFAGVDLFRVLCLGIVTNECECESLACPCNSLSEDGGPVHVLNRKLSSVRLLTYRQIGWDQPQARIRDMDLAGICRRRN